MNNAPRLRAAEDLRQQTQALTERLSALAEAVQNRVVQPLSAGSLPALTVVDDIRAAAEAIHEIGRAALGAGLIEQPTISLPELLDQLARIIERESWTAILDDCRLNAQRVLSIVHKSGQTPPFVEELHRQARRCLEEISSAILPADTSAGAWEGKFRTFRDLWLLLNEPDVLNDLQAEEALSRLEHEFGRSLVSALTLRRLLVRTGDLPAPGAPAEGQTQQVLAACSPGADAPSQPITSEVSVAEVQSRELLASSFGEGHAKSSSSDASAGHIFEPAPVTATLTVPIQRPASEATSRAQDLSVQKEVVVSSSHHPHDIAASEAVLNHQRRLEIRKLIWRMVGAGRTGLAYQIALCVESLLPAEEAEPSALLRAAALGPAVRVASGEVVDDLRRSVDALQSWIPHWQDGGEHFQATRLLVLGLALRPTLLAPGTGALSLLEAVSTVDSLSTALAEIRRTIVEFGSLNLELSPSVLKGVRDHAVWQQQLDELREEARAWLESNRLANIIYAATTDVWHRWLASDGALGLALEILSDHRAERAEEVRKAARYWSVQKNVEKELDRTDGEIRKIGARRRPIEARARKAICSRAQEFVQYALSWLNLLATEPHTLDDFRQQRADRCRNVVQRFLPTALTDVAAHADTDRTSAALTGAAWYARKALEDIGHLFDPARQEDPQPLPERIVLGEELLALTDVALDEVWRPTGAEREQLLRRLEEASAETYDPEKAFNKHSEVRNHLATERVIEALMARRDGQPLAERLENERSDAVVHCRQALRRKLDETRQSTEQAVCYDLITDEERARFLGAVEECRLLLEEVADFGAEHRRLDEIDHAIAAKRQQRVREVEQKLSATTIPPDREADLEVINQALQRGDFLSADEYIELIRRGQPLIRTAEPNRVVITEFFPDFVNSFNSFMEGDGRNRPDARDVLERIREGRTAGPIAMRGVPRPQASEAAEMVTAWLRLKSGSTDVVKDLTKLLTAFGFRNVEISLDKSPKPPYWLAVAQCTPLGDPTVCIVPHFGSQAKGRYRILGLVSQSPSEKRPDEETIVSLVREVREAGGTEPILVLYFGRMIESRRRDLAELCWQRRRQFLTIDEALVFFLCSERFSRLPIHFQCALPFTVAEPYTTTASLVPVEMFFGRERERRAILDPYGTNLVFGGRQLGKSALLRDVERREHNPAQGRVVRWIDLKNRGIGIDRPAEDLWAVLGQELHAEQVLPRPATTYQTVVDRIRDWLKGADNRRILLLLDEADAFLEADSRAVNEQTRHSFPEVARLKGLMDDTDRRFKVVFAGLHNVQRAARDPNTPVAHLGTPVCIGPLLDGGEWRQARDLIEIPFRHMGYNFEPSDLWMRILSYTNYYPSLIQVFCKHLLEYLHDRDRTIFDFRTSPPYPVNAQHIEDVYQSEDLQREIRHKFELTLGLDERYRLIALCIALASIEQREERALVDGFDVAWVREQALSWWATGFALDSSFELFRTILDEMIGLGILRRAGLDRYALRSPNVLNLLGSKSQIEQKLIDVAGLPAPPSYEAASFRRSLNGDCWARSPLTAEQEASLIERTNGVAIVYGSPLGGLNDLRSALAVVPSQKVRFAESMKQPKQFTEWLRDVDRTRSESEGVTLAVVMPETCWSRAWVTAADDFVRRKTSSTKRFLRVVFAAGPELAWECFEDNPAAHLGVTELSLKPWREAALRRWMEDAEFGSEAVNSCRQILTQTGGWGMLVHALGEVCRGEPQKWREQLAFITQSWPNDPRWNHCCGLPPAVLPVLRVMADWDPIDADELATLASGADVSRVLRWGDRLGYVREVEPDRWTLDPLVRLLVTARG